jgi:hypothetical protein
MAHTAQQRQACMGWAHRSPLDRRDQLSLAYNVQQQTKMQIPLLGIITSMWSLCDRGWACILNACRDKMEGGHTRHRTATRTQEFCHPPRYKG